MSKKLPPIIQVSDEDFNDLLARIPDDKKLTMTRFKSGKISDSKFYKIFFT